MRESMPPPSPVPRKRATTESHDFPPVFSYLRPMPTRAVNGTELYFEDTGGSGPVVVFSHGLLMNHRMFAAQVAGLRGKFRCISYDHRGHGGSAAGVGRIISTEQTYQDAVALLEALGVGCGSGPAVSRDAASSNFAGGRERTGPVHFVGLSMGGFVGMRLAARRPDLVAKLVVLESSAEREPSENILKYKALGALARVVGVRPLVGAVTPILFGKTFLTDPSKKADLAHWKAELARNAPGVYRAANGVIEREAILAELPQIAAPTLVLVGEEDVATVPAKSERIAATIPGARLVTIPKAGHSSTVENPEFVTEQLAAFLA
jgi:pimeloyl-ACP methyl ester carboxylesterase